MIVEGHTGADHINEGRAAVIDRALDQRHQLRFVAREPAADLGCAELHGHGDQIDR
jgi:hypothetical protein